MNKFLIYLCLFIICIRFSQQIFFILDPYESRCISRYMQDKTVFSGVYFISGEQEDGNKAVIKNEEGHILWQAFGQKNSNFEIDILKTGEYSLCLETTANYQLTVSFEFFDEKKDEQLISVRIIILTVIENIENLNTVIHTIRRKMDIIHSNMRNSAVRRGTHLSISGSINSKITFYTVIKILFLVLFSLFQIMMLTSIFGNVKVMSKISVQEPRSKACINNISESSLFL